jgi:hypothetical protein
VLLDLGQRRARWTLDGASAKASQTLSTIYNNSGDNGTSPKK